MFGEVAQKVKGVMLGRGVQVWFSECVLALPQASKKSLVSC